MRYRQFKFLALFGILSMFFTSCVKDDTIELTDQGTTMLKFVEAPEKNFYFSPFSDVRNVDLFSLRKDANSAASLNTATTVTVTTVPALIEAYNDANGTNYEPLPDSIYTITNSGIQKSGNSFTVTFSPGQFSQEFSIGLNGAKWDIAHTYAMAFVIADAGGTALASGRDTMYALISVKNKYDGIYRMQGYHNRDPYTFPYDTEIHMITAGPNSVIFYWPMAGSNGHPIGIGPGEMSWYGAAISPVVVFDPETDLVTNVYNNVAGTAITLFTGEGSRLSRFNAADRSMTVDWNYGNNPLRAFFDDLTFIRERE